MTDSYIVMYGGVKVGYGSIKGNEHISNRDTVFEFYLIPSFRRISATAFSEFLHSSKASFIESQSNEPELTSLLYQFGTNINATAILFEDNATSLLNIENAVLRKCYDNDVVFEHKSEPLGDFVLGINNELVASGGFALHYNTPFADLYMEVKEDYRKIG